MENINCPKCGEKQWSKMDKSYVKLFKICWQCDYDKFKNGEMSECDFNKREKQAYQSIT